MVSLLGTVYNGLSSLVRVTHLSEITIELIQGVSTTRQDELRIMSALGKKLV